MGRMVDNETGMSDDEDNVHEKQEQSINNRLRSEKGLM
jgi:hypothetical protein